MNGLIIRNKTFAFNVKKDATETTLGDTWGCRKGSIVAAGLRTYSVSYDKKITIRTSI